MADLPVEIFAQLRRRFFDDAGRPVPFPLRDKQNTQDDPFDEFLASKVFDDLPCIRCEKAGGPLVAPDMVCYRPDGIDGATPADLAGDASRIIALEVKKLERTRRGKVARGSGLDYYTTRLRHAVACASTTHRAPWSTFADSICSFVWRELLVGSWSPGWLWSTGTRSTTISICIWELPANERKELASELTAMVSIGRGRCSSSQIRSAYLLSIDLP